ncbi:MAG: LysM peptidoglycan-binding domain-containing protein [Acidobacteria bacterium]|nr:LysM peptidoglycan-binding domain-containing protein [Acidobacteriota bacterium]
MRTAAKFLLGLLLYLLWVGAASGLAQSLGDIARKERQRRPSHPQRAVHVYTNEDLTRPQILDPEDRVRIEAYEQSPISELTKDVTTTLEPSSEIPLGDIARAIRKKKRSLQGRPEEKESAKTRVSPAAELEAQNSREVLQTSPLPSQAQAATEPTVPSSEIPLGDLARMLRERRRSYQRQTEPTATMSLSPAADSEEQSSRAALSRQATARAKKTTVIASTRSVAAKTHPSRAVRPQVAPQVVHPPNRIRVRRGDSLWTIARRHLNSGTKWKEIAFANPQLANPNRIFPGQWLEMPEPSTVNAATLKVKIQPNLGATRGLPQTGDATTAPSSPHPPPSRSSGRYARI